MLNEWVLNWLNTLKNAFKQNKTVSVKDMGYFRVVDGVVDLEKLKEVVHEIIKVTNPPNYDYLELDGLDYMSVDIDGEPTTVDFDIRKLMEEQI